jgi:hypothetical protein
MSSVWATSGRSVEGGRVAIAVQRAAGSRLTIRRPARQRGRDVDGSEELRQQVVGRAAERRDHLQPASDAAADVLAQLLAVLEAALARGSPVGN